MSMLEIGPRTGMGVAGAIASLIGPVVGGAADAYSTHEQSKISRAELAQRAVEFDKMQEFRQKQLKAQERQHALAQQAALQQAQIGGYYKAGWMPYVLGAVGLVALAVAAGAAVRGRRR